MKKLLSLIMALMLCMGVAAAEDAVIGGADGPTDITVCGPAFILPGDLETAAIEAGRKGTSTLAVTEVSGINTGDAELDAALVDLLKALGVKSTVQGDETEFALTISGTDVLSLGVAVSEDDLYLKSNLLGGTIVVGADEVETVLNRLVDMLVMSEAMTEEDAAAAREELSWLVETFKVMLENGALATLTEEDILALDFSALKETLETVWAKAQIVENPVVPRNCDPAVAGMTLNASNEDMILVIKAMIQFVKDNPKLMAYIAAQTGMYTEGQLAGAWEVYSKYGIFETEEEFRADGNFSIEETLDEALAELDGKKLLDGDYVINICMGEDGMPVYMTFTLPMFIEQETLYTYHDSDVTETTEVVDPVDLVGETKVIEVVYSRLMVAQGVSHVVNITVDGKTLTADTLVSGNTAHIVLSAPDEEPIIIDATVEGNTLTAKLTSNPDEETAITCTFEGSYLCSDAEYVLTGKLTVESVFTPEDTETPTLNGMALPGFEAHKPKAETNTLTLDINADYDRNGVDFNGVTDIIIDYNDVRVALQANSFTSEPGESIMAGEVVRPAELDEAAFANWFVGVVNTLNSWSGNLMMALPESLLSMLMYSGM